LADGYFVIPYTLGAYLAQWRPTPVSTGHEAFTQAVAQVREGIQKLRDVGGNEPVRDLWRRLGHICWERVGMSRNAQGLQQAIQEIKDLRQAFWQDLCIPGGEQELNKNLEMAGRVADYLEFAELLAVDALHREESCGGHFREEYQTPEGEALRNDERFSYVAAWEFTGDPGRSRLHKEPLTFQHVHPGQRSYK